MAQGQGVCHCLDAKSLRNLSVLPASKYLSLYIYMGRPRLYHTDEERRAADALKSKRYYQRNKKTITKQRRKEYSKSLRNKGVSKPKSESTGPSTSKSPQAGLSTLVEAAHSAALKMHAYFGENIGQQVVTRLQDKAQRYQNCLAELQELRKDLEAAMAAVNSVQQEISNAQNRVYETSGVQKEWRSIKLIHDSVRDVQRGLEGVMADVIESISALEDEV
ncbi:hypothetical protein BKA70DRAFT_1418382 [Coprinopsis sp. MPI-PUGE-AT-0042]|nr:hypothetical protein BKA70DRAFT_1418382 [Coprinopsis sp. MPI-PUGE-AT-0042]